MSDKITQYEESYKRDKESFKKYLIECIKNPNNKDKAWKDNNKSYLDIDNVYGSYHDFYYDLEKYLNKMNIKSKYKKKSGIKVYKSNLKLRSELKLRSDQLGFSAPHKSAIAWDNRYPYAKYLLNGGDAELVSNVIWNARSLGGSFLWPVIPGGSLFNRDRGVGSYIEDRADLTLWEIKKFYEYLNDNNNNETSKRKYKYITTEMNKNKYILLKNKDSRKIYLWLKYFENFENFINILSFKDNEKGNNFCDKDGNIRNLTNDEMLNDEYVNKLKNNNKRTIKNDLKINEIENMINKLNTQIITRTRIMEDIINGETNKK